MVRKYSFIIILLLLSMASCIKPPDYSIVPRIEFVSMSGNTFNELGGESISVVVYFEDGDGDIGTEDSVNMLWEDSRFPGFFIPFKIPVLEVSGNSKAISGTITTEYPITFCQDDAIVVDTFYYKIFIEDRAGHMSNIDSTDAIYLNCN